MKGVFQLRPYVHKCYGGGGAAEEIIINLAVENRLKNRRAPKHRHYSLKLLVASVRLMFAYNLKGVGIERVLKNVCGLSSIKFKYSCIAALACFCVSALVRAASIFFISRRRFVIVSTL